MEKIKVIALNNVDRAEGDDWYRLDEPGEGERFFKNILTNEEFDGREEIKLLEITPEQWAEAERLGEEMA